MVGLEDCPLSLHEVAALSCEPHFGGIEFGCLILGEAELLADPRVPTLRALGVSRRAASVRRVLGSEQRRREEQQPGDSFHLASG